MESAPCLLPMPTGPPADAHTRRPADRLSRGLRDTPSTTRQELEQTRCTAVQALCLRGAAKHVIHAGPAGQRDPFRRREPLSTARIG